MITVYVIASVVVLSAISVICYLLYRLGSAVASIPEKISLGSGN